MDQFLTGEVSAEDEAKVEEACIELWTIVVILPFLGTYLLMSTLTT